MILTVIMTGLGFIDVVPPGFWALAGSVLGAALLKYVEKYLNKSADRREDRKSFNDEIKGLRTRLDTVEAEVTFWRNRFYEEQEENSMLRVVMINGGVTPPAKRIIPLNEQNPPVGE